MIHISFEFQSNDVFFHFRHKIFKEKKYRIIEFYFLWFSLVIYHEKKRKGEKND
jgi:hypothetical protein